MHGISLSYLRLTACLYPILGEHLQKRNKKTYKTLEVLGPEHEFSIVDDQLRALPIVDKVIKDVYGRIVNFVQQRTFSFGKELQLHVMEVKPNTPFESPVEFEEIMQKAVLTLEDFLQRKYKARLLGTGMHPLLRLDETSVWPHRHRQIYRAYSQVFNLKRHGWLNIQSFQLNLPYTNEKDGVSLYNVLAEVCAYLPAVSASSPVYEGAFGESTDNRLRLYAENQKEVPSVVGDVVPEYVSTFRQYRDEIIGRYSLDLAAAGASETILNKDWVNSRGVIFRFDRRAIEIRIMDEQECVKSDVALSCFTRAALRGMTEQKEYLPHDLLTADYNTVVRDGLDAKVKHPKGQTAKEVCKHLFDIAWNNATSEEKRYLPLIRKRIERGSLSNVIRKSIQRKGQRTEFKEALISVYSELVRNLIDNRPYL